MPADRRGRHVPAWEFVPVAVLLAVWEVVARLGLVPGQFYFPPFSAVLREFYHLTVGGVLLENFLSSLVRVVAGFTAGSIAGVLVGTAMGWKENVNKALNPVISLLYPIPALGWLPLLMIWFGVSELLPVIVVFICSFFPVLYNTVNGIRNVDEEYVAAARTLGASDGKVLLTVVIPLALPSIFTGLRLEAGMAWRVIIAAEMVAIPTGIGALLMKAESLVRIDIIIVCMMVLSVMCLLFEKIFIFLEEKVTGRWR